jgi:hypothetical protein
VEALCKEGFFIWMAYSDTTHQLLFRMDLARSILGVNIKTIHETTLGK